MGPTNLQGTRVELGAPCGPLCSSLCGPICSALRLSACSPLQAALCTTVQPAARRLLSRARPSPALTGPCGSGTRRRWPAAPRSPPAAGPAGSAAPLSCPWRRTTRAGRHCNMRGCRLGRWMSGTPPRACSGSLLNPPAPAAAAPRGAALRELWGSAGSPHAHGLRPVWVPILCVVLPGDLIRERFVRLRHRGGGGVPSALRCLGVAAPPAALCGRAGPPRLPLPLSTPRSHTLVMNCAKYSAASGDGFLSGWNWRESLR